MGWSLSGSGSRSPQRYSAVTVDCAPAVRATQIVTGGSAEAWQRGTMVHLFPKGRYRNKWYQTGHENGAYCGIGIHGQWLYVNPKTEVVIAKMGSQPVPEDHALEREIVAFFEALSRMV